MGKGFTRRLGGTEGGEDWPQKGTKGSKEAAGCGDKGVLKLLRGRGKFRNEGEVSRNDAKIAARIAAKTGGELGKLSFPGKCVPKCNLGTRNAADTRPKAPTAG